MIETEMFDIILQKCRIIKEYLPLPESILGYYYCDWDYYMIMLNESIQGDEKPEVCSG